MARMWVIQDWDGHWGGWRTVRHSWLSEQPAKFNTQSEAKVVMAIIKKDRPWARLRVIKG